MTDLLTTEQAAGELGITPRRLLVLIRDKRLPAHRHGRDWAIEREALELVRERRPGRPRKVCGIHGG